MQVHMSDVDAEVAPSPFGAGSHPAPSNDQLLYSRTAVKIALTGKLFQVRMNRPAVA